MASRAGFKNRQRLKRILKALPEKERARIKVALRAAADEIVATQKQLAPVLTGALRDSIVATPGDQDLPAYASVRGRARTKDPELAMILSAGNSKVRYAHLQEYGTVTMPAQPFFGPGFRAHRKDAVRKINKAAKQAIKDAVKGRLGT